MSDSTLQVMITAISGIVVAFITAIGPELMKKSKPPAPKSARSATGVPSGVILRGIVGGVVGVLLGLWLAPVVTSILNPPTPALTISEPQDGAVVPRVVGTSGTWEHIPEDQRPWVLVFPHEAPRYYPQQQARLFENGEWSGNVFVGNEDGEQTGQLFDIVVGLADDAAHRELADYMTRSENAGSFGGLDALPAGFVLYDRVTVTRE